MLNAGSLDCALPKTTKFPPSWQTSTHAHIKNLRQYEALYQSSLEDSDAFWLQQAASLDWIRFPTQSCNYSWNTAKRDIRHSWFEDGLINVSLNCLDRHLLTRRRDQIAIIWQGDSDEETRTFTFAELHSEVCRFANALKCRGIRKGDRVCLYLPMIPEAVIAMLACARIGAIHTVVFGGFSAESLTHRILDSGAKMVITANVGLRGGKILPLKEIVDAAVLETPAVETILVVKRTNDPCQMGKRDIWVHDITAGQPAYCPAETMKAEDPLFILHTSG